MTAYETIIRKLLAGNNEEIIKFFRQKRLLRSKIKCTSCHENMKIVYCANVKDKQVFRCNNKECIKIQTTRSIRSESFFQEFNISFKDILELIYRFSKEERISKIMIDLSLSKNTVISFFQRIRSLCTKFLVDNPINVGGDGVIVQIDESCFSQQPKYH